MGTWVLGFDEGNKGDNDVRANTFDMQFLNKTSHDTFGILILGTHCVLKIRPRDTLGPSIKIICLAIIQTSHDTCQPVPYRTVPILVPCRTVRYRTVQTAYGHRKYMSKAGIDPALPSLNTVNRKKSRVPRMSRKSVEIRNGALDTLGQIY